MSTIKPGDLVMVVKPRTCGCAGRIGAIYRVGLVVVTRFLPCDACGARDPGGMAAVDLADSNAAAISRLIKIDDPAQPEHVERGEEVTA